MYINLCYMNRNGSVNKIYISEKDLVFYTFCISLSYIGFFLFVIELCDLENI